MKKVGMKTENAVRVVTHFADFRPKDESTKNIEWEIAFYKLWEYQMRWDYAYSIELRQNKNEEMYVSILTRPATENGVRDVLYSLGFGKVTVRYEKIGMVDSLDLDNDVYEVRADW